MEDADFLAQCESETLFNRIDIARLYRLASGTQKVSSESSLTGTMIHVPVERRDELIAQARERLRPRRPLAEVMDKRPLTPNEADEGEG